MMSNTKKNLLSKFNPVLFWDTDMKGLDAKKHMRYIIERVVTRGNMSDWQRIKDIYGVEKIKNTSVQIRFLDLKTLSFLSSYFNIEKDHFRCYKNK